MRLFLHLPLTVRWLTAGALVVTLAIIVVADRWTAGGPFGAGESPPTTEPWTTFVPASPGQPTATPYPFGSRFETLPPGAPLPSGALCAERVRRSGFEPRPENTKANQQRGTRISRIDGASRQGDARFAPRIDGDFTGTTDEIIQWGACKWGFDEDIVRAVAWQESGWLQSAQGDREQGEFVSFGILQVKRTVHKGTYPTSRRSTAFNVDYALAWRRACFEGDFAAWMTKKNASYRAGDEWGCIGAWFSGNWYTRPAEDYLAKVRVHLNQQPWRKGE